MLFSFYLRTESAWHYTQHSCPVYLLSYSCSASSLRRSIGVNTLTQTQTAAVIIPALFYSGHVQRASCPPCDFFLKMETSRPLCTHRQRYSNTYPKIQPVLKKIGARANTHFEGEEWMWRIALTCQRPIFVPIIFTVLGLSKCQNPDWRRAELIKMQKLSSESPWVITLCSQI